MFINARETTVIIIIIPLTNIKVETVRLAKCKRTSEYTKVEKLDN